MTDRFLVFQVSVKKMEKPLDVLMHRNAESETLIGAYSSFTEAERELGIPTNILSDNLEGGDPFDFNGTTYDVRWESGWLRHLELTGKGGKPDA